MSHHPPTPEIQKVTVIDQSFDLVSGFFRIALRLLQRVFQQLKNEGCKLSESCFDPGLITFD